MFTRPLSNMAGTRAPCLIWQVLTRFLLLLEPNASRVANASVALGLLEGRLRALLSEELHGMQAIAEGHATVPNYLQVSYRVRVWVRVRSCTTCKR